MGCENEMEMVIEKGSGVRVCDLLTLNKQEYKLNCLLNECLPSPVLRMLEEGLMNEAA